MFVSVIQVDFVTSFK